MDMSLCPFILHVVVKPNGKYATVAYLQCFVSQACPLSIQFSGCALCEL
jgi:hypothetical protein